ncbi:hypothetical protein ACFSR7_04610 [Cohnella sp. GCM10020058]|uniref:hypothetical protein n=1 Tax=Cohnella sp. GCM10020058 TaxID=3317330 RepID=UPI00362FA5CA
MAEKKALPLALAAALALTALAGCSDGGNNNANPASGSPAASGAASAQSSAEAPFSYTFLDTVHPTALFGYNNPNDVVTPVVEQKFNVKVSDIVFSAGQSPVERVNMLVAANNLPDVVLVDNPNLSLLYSTGAFADLSEYQNLMVNTDKYVSDTGWNSLKVAGKLVALPTSAMPDAGNPEVAAAMQADIFHRDPVNWAFMLREDILKKLGYKFKTVKEIQAELDQNPRQLTDADLQLDPPIKTPEDFEKLLYDIQKLDFKVDGKPVIPLSIPDWGAYHISSLYAPTGGYYANPDTGEVAGFIDNPNMKTYYAKLRQWFKDGVLDKDYLLQKPEQLQQKIASGRVAAMFSVPDTNGARTSLKQLDPEAELRPIPWPKSQYEIDTGHASYVDPSYPAGFYNIMINKNVKDIPRLLKYFDWFQTEEAMDLSVWGPESAGLYELKDGVKVFKDQALYEAIRDGKKTADGKNAEYYGIYDKNNTVSTYTSKAFLTAPAPFYNNKTFEHSYPAKFDAWNDMWAFVSTIKLSKDGTVLSPSGEKSNALSNYYWNTFRTSDTAKLLSTKSEAEFDKKWEELKKTFEEKGGYDAAIAEMKPLFDRALGKS